METQKTFHNNIYIIYIYIYIYIYIHVYMYNIYLYICITYMTYVMVNLSFYTLLSETPCIAFCVAGLLSIASDYLQIDIHHD